MNTKKIICVIMLSAIICLTMIASASEKPTAIMGDTLSVGSVLTGVYEYSGREEQGNSIFRWYMSEDFFDKGVLIEGACSQSFTVNKDTYGKFITFAVVPIDINGVQGDEVCAEPVMQNQGFYEDFNTTLPENLKKTVTSGGYVEIVSNPDGNGNVLAFNKPALASFKTESRIYFDRVTSTKSVVDAKIYVSDISGDVRLFSINDGEYGNVIELIVDSSGALYYRGGNGKKITDYNFETNKWYHIVVEINGNDNTVNLIVDDTIIAENEPWRFENSGYDNISFRFMNYGNGGTIYFDDISVMNLIGSESAEADIQWITENMPTEVTDNIDFPSKGLNGSTIYWVSAKPEYITNKGVISRPPRNKSDVEVYVTAYVINGTTVIKKEFIILVPKSDSNPPIIKDVTITQNNSRAIKVSYTYPDDNIVKEGETTIVWYVEKEPGKYEPIKGENSYIYIPESGYDGKNIRVCIIPKNEANVVGEAVYSEPINYKYFAAAQPVANVGTTEYGLVYLKGNYSYDNYDGVPEGESEYFWYISDKLFGEYEIIPNENKCQLENMSEYDGRFIKFAVKPISEDGISGDITYADPVYVKYNEAQTFEKNFDLNKNIDFSSLAGGTITIDTDPTNNLNTALKLKRTATSGGMSKIIYKIPEYNPSSGMIIEADLYASSDAKGVWEAFYLCDAGQSQAYKLWANKSNLLSRGGAYINQNGDIVNDSTQIIGADLFKRDMWHQVKVVLDFDNQTMVKTEFDGVVVQTDLPFRNNVKILGTILSYFQGSETGTAYIDNLKLTPIYNYSGFSRADASYINIGNNLDTVSDNINLPNIGEKYGSYIEWKSSDSSVITDDGIVIRPPSGAEDAKVTLTAHIINGNDYYTRDFHITVLHILNDEESTIYDSVEIMNYDGIILNDDIILPTEGKHGSRIEWSSSDESVISNSGKITQQTEKRIVEFMVTIKKGGYVSTKQIKITVAPKMPKNFAVKGGTDSSSVKREYPSANLIDEDYTTYWMPDEDDKSPYVILDMGTKRMVNKLYMAEKERNVKSISIFGSDDYYNWHSANIKSNLTDDIVNLIDFDAINHRFIKIQFESDTNIAIGELSIMYDKTDIDKVRDSINRITLNNTTVNSDFELITSFGDGVVAEWKSSNENVIKIIGGKAIITRLKSDTPVSITVTVISGSVKEEKNFNVIVEGTTSSNSSSGGGGGSSSNGGKTNGGVYSAMGIGTSAAPPVNISASTGFCDIASVPWAVDAINSLSAIGVVNGTSATNFEPERNITREEFAAMLYRGFGFGKNEEKGKFTDVKPSDWYYEPVMQLTTLGIIKGVGDGSFGIGRTITRQDMAVMIYRAALTANARFTAERTEFADADKIASYAREAVDVLSGAKIVNGVGGGIFNPTGNATRAEATIILYRIINYVR